MVVFAQRPGGILALIAPAPVYSEEQPAVNRAASIRGREGGLRRVVRFIATC